MLLTRLKAQAFRAYYNWINRKVWADHSTGQDIDTSHLVIPVSAGDMRARMYHGSAERPLIIYYHGGGWCIGNLDTHDACCRAIAHASGCTVVALDYRLAPEHPFPAAHNDCLDGTKWLIEHLEHLAPNNGTIVLAGDSAGGNLTAATGASLLPNPKIAGTCMIYPATEHYLAGLPSFTEHAKSKPLTMPILRWFMDTYLAGHAPADPETKTIFVNRRTDYRHFPPSLIITAERDPLRDDGKRLAIKMRQAGVAVSYEHYAQEAHGFASSEGPTDGHLHLINRIAEWLDSLPKKVDA